MHYSYRNDCITSCSAARFAGKNPNAMPMVMEIANETSTDINVIMVIMPAVFSMTILIMNPKIIPMIPPTTLMVVASARN